MRFLNKHKGKIIAVLGTILLLALAFFCGEPQSRTETKASESIARPTEEMQSKEAPLQTEAPEASPMQTEKPTEAPNKTGEPQTESKADIAENKVEISEALPNESAVPAESNELHCSLSVTCRNALGKTKEKSSVLPENGVFFEEQSVVFYEGETVFNVLVREMKQHKIHLEFVNIPLYNSAYIEGIGNLYEFDCGELSGWMYKVNGTFPNYGSSRCPLQNGDRIEWVYTCDLGKDVGGDSSARNGMEYE